MNKKDFSIGATYEGNNSAFLKAVRPYVSHVQVSPDSIVHQGTFENYIRKDVIDDLLTIADDIDILVQGSGLSIGSFDGYSQSYIKVLEELFYYLPVKWHSEQLAYTAVGFENDGIMLTLPKTDEALEIICRRVDAIQKKFKIPFLLENASNILPAAECKYSDAAFLNKISELTGCGLILNLYNLENDAYIFNLKVNNFMDELNADSIYEVHLAGVLTESNFQLDPYSRYAAPVTTLQMLQSFLKRSPKNLTELTYEINKSATPSQTSNIIKQLVLLNQLLNEPNDPFNTLANHFIIPDQMPVN